MYGLLCCFLMRYNFHVSSIPDVLCRRREMYFINFNVTYDGYVLYLELTGEGQG